MVLILLVAGVCYGELIVLLFLLMTLFQSKIILYGLLSRVLVMLFKKD